MTSTHMKKQISNQNSQKFHKSISLFSISNDLAYLTVVDQVMPYEEGFKSSANQKWLLKKYFTDSHKSVWNTATGFLHSNCQAFNGQIFDFSRKIASMYYFSNLAYALLLHIVVKPCQLSDLKVLKTFGFNLTKVTEV